jgi:hypothetical protein
MNAHVTFGEAKREILRVLAQEPFDAWRSVHLEQAIRLLRNPAHPGIAAKQAKKAERAPADRDRQELADFGIANKRYAPQSREALQELLQAVCAGSE